LYLIKIRNILQFTLNDNREVGLAIIENKHFN